MDKIAIFDEQPKEPKNFLALTDEGGTIDLDVTDKAGEYQGTLIRINKETLEVSTPKDLPSRLGFETNRKGELEIYERE